MMRYDSTEPADVVDRLLYREAQQMISRHCGPDQEGGCQWCGLHWPCPARRLAERAEVAACQPVPWLWPGLRQRNDPGWLLPARHRSNGGPFG